MYKDLPIIKISVIRGNDKIVQLRNIVVNGVNLNFTDLNPMVQFKSVVDSNINVSFDKTIDNGGMEVTDESLKLIFKKETANLQISKYYGDLLVTIDDKNATIVRFELDLTGAVTTDNR